MGAHLASATYHEHWVGLLTMTELRVLTYMALRALDAPRPGQAAGMYYAGEEAIIIALTGDLPAYGTPQYRTQHGKVSKIIRRLVDVAAVTRVVVGRRGRASVYRLTLWSFAADLGPSTPVDNPPGLRPPPAKRGEE